MTNDQLAAILGAFLLANAASVAMTVKWVFKHLLEYQLLQKQVEQHELKLLKQEKDITAAHNKIRNK